MEVWQLCAMGSGSGVGAASVRETCQRFDVSTWLAVGLRSNQMPLGFCWAEMFMTFLQKQGGGGGDYNSTYIEDDFFCVCVCAHLEVDVAL